MELVKDRTDTRERGPAALKRQPVSVLLLACCLAVFVFACADWFDTDGLFIIATGRKMRQAGMLYTHPFTVDQSLHTVIQQWLWCWIVSVAYDWLGCWGMFLITLLGQLVMVLLFYAYLKDDRGRNDLLIFVLCLLMVSMNQYTSIRPEIVTLDLLTAQCLCVKKFIDTDRPGWLYWLPVLMLAEINLHASYWIMHYILLLTYAVPSILPKLFPRDGISLASFRKNKRHFLTVFVLMTAALFLNPYGTEGIGYVFRSLKADITELGIQELRKMTYFSALGGEYLLVYSVFLLCVLRKKLTGVSLYMLCGLLLLHTLAIKWFLFFSLVLLFLADCWREELYQLPVEKLKIHRIERILAACIVAFFLIAAVQKVTTCEEIEDENEACIVSLLDEQRVPKDTPIYTGFNIGARMEFEGYERIFIDARPELYSRIINGRRDMLDEYFVMRNGCHLNGDPVPDTVRAIDQILEEYDFEYLIVSLSKEQLLDAHLTASDSYSRIYDSQTYRLYQKIT